MSQRNLVLASVVGIVAIIVVVGLFMRTMSIQNAQATATQVMVAQFAQETTTAETAIFLVEQSQTAEAEQSATVQAEQTSTAQVQSSATEAAIIVEQTQSAQSTSTAVVLGTSDAQTSEALTEVAASETALALSIQQTDAAVATATQMALPTATPSPSPLPSPTLTPTDMPVSSPTPTNTPRPTRTSTPEFVIGEADEGDTRQVLLRYDGRLLIVTNRDGNDPIDVRDLVFVRFEPDEAGEFQETETLELEDVFGSQTNFVPQGRCLQILDSREFRSLPTENSLAEDLCMGSPFWITTSSIFWVSDNREAYFEVRLGPIDVLARCPINTPQTRRELRCAVDMNLP